MKVVRQFQPWPTHLLQHLLPIRTVRLRQLATMSGVREETGIEAVGADEAEAEEGRVRAEDVASAPKTRGSVIRSAIWAEASGSTQPGGPLSCLTN